MGGLVRLAALLAGAAPVALALASGGGDGGGGVPASHEDQIRQLVEDGVKYVRQHRLSDIYDLYSQEFRDRCSRPDFLRRADDCSELAAALDTEISEEECERLAREWRESQETELVGVENIQVQGDTASANVVTMWSSTWPVFNLPPPQKHVEGAYFVKEDEKWHLVPQPGTSGCDTTSPQDVPPIPPE